MTVFELQLQGQGGDATDRVHVEGLITNRSSFGDENLLGSKSPSFCQFAESFKENKTDNFDTYDQNLERETRGHFAKTHKITHEPVRVESKSAVGTPQKDPTQDAYQTRVQIPQIPNFQKSQNDSAPALKNSHLQHFDGILKEIQLHKAESRKILEIQEKKASIF